MLTIETLDEGNACGFGGGVHADRKYKQTNSKKPKYFIDGENRKIYFNKTSPEKYLQ